jgi:pyruvate dehydrogenase E1 component
MIPEAIEAAALLESDEGIAASVLAITSPDRLYRGWRSAQMAQLADAHAGRAQSHLDLLFEDQPEPIVSVIDGASHALAFLGSALGRKQVALGVDRFGQSGSLPDVYEEYDLSPDAIASAAVAALCP